MAMQEEIRNENLMCFLSEAEGVAHLCTKQCDMVINQVDDVEFQQHVRAFRKDARRGAEAIEQVISDLGGRRMQVDGFGEAMNRLIGRQAQGDAYRKFEDLENLLTLAYRHRSNTEVLRAIGETSDDPRLKGAANFLENTVEHVSWLAAKVDELAPKIILRQQVERVEHEQMPRGEVIPPEEYGEQPAV